ncbi:hypothetical protein FIBSPDRAFT_1037888 [Athelia psychrophila]|uniref:Uncharacterized protein n=1 Tax=Athelia psychrophila TaxID=1759441 RepID=A0A166TU70_9AGAM|nr:hypothetical protein FIBSPDRAFT_1037888 [Fibularhizoctonia sp. CBS 109695]
MPAAAMHTHVQLQPIPTPSPHARTNCHHAALCAYASSPYVSAHIVPYARAARHMHRSPRTSAPKVAATMYTRLHSVPTRACSPTRPRPVSTPTSSQAHTPAPSSYACARLHARTPPRAPARAPATHALMAVYGRAAQSHTRATAYTGINHPNCYPFTPASLFLESCPHPRSALLPELVEAPARQYAQVEADEFERVAFE